MLEPMSIMFASKGYKVDDVVQEVRGMQSGWQHSDYRAWLKHYTTGKRPRSVLEDSKQLLRRDGADTGAGPRDMSTGWHTAFFCGSAHLIANKTVVKFSHTSMLSYCALVLSNVCIL